MTLLTAIRCRRYSPSIAGIALLAWSVLLATPCASAFILDGPPTQSTEIATELVAYHDCHNLRPDKPMKPSDDMLRVKPSEAPELSSVLALAAGAGIVVPVAKGTVIVDRQSLLHGTSPPVYLATQRLRI